MVKHRQCLECGTDLPPAMAGGRRGGRIAEFCSTAHRQAWNNRRMQNGAILYDLFMAHRYDRNTATELGLLTIINRLGMHFRENDIQERGSRRSWRPPRDVIGERPYLKAEIMMRAAKPKAEKTA